MSYFLVHTFPTSLHIGCDQYLYLFQHCATKSMCEAVLEGMGSVWDEAAEEKRGSSFDYSQKEAMIAYNGPAAYTPEAKPFVARALNHHFKGKDWNFVHRDPRQRQLQFTAGSKTLERKRTEKTRLPAAMYDVPAA